MVRLRRSKALLGMLLALSLVAAACGGDDDDDEGAGEETGTIEVREGGTITYPSEQESPGFNNLTTKDNLLELRHMMGRVWPEAYMALPDLSVEPTPLLDGPAEVVSEDPFTVEWKIAQEAVWDDGTPFTADDFEWVYLSCNGKIDPGEPTAKDEESGEDITGVDCASSSGYDLVTTFEKPDAKTVRLTFSEIYVEYEGLFGDPIPPSHIGKAREGGWNTGFDADAGASAGPYKLSEFVRGDHYTLVRNDKYWGPRPKLDSIIYRVVPDPATHPDTLRNDETQVIYPQPQVDLVEQINSIPGVKSDINFGPTWEHLDFNFQNELLAIKEVRQAIAWGLDRDRYVNTLMKPFSDQATRLDNRLFMSNQPEYEAHGQEYATRSVEKATAALEEAGFTKGSDGIYAKGGDKLSFRLRVKSPNPLREQLEQLIQADLKPVGIDIRIDNFAEPDSIGSVGSAGDFDLFIFAWVGTPFEVSGAKQEFESVSASNFGKYNSAEVDAAIRKAGSTLDEDERVKILNEVDELLWEDLATIPLFQKPSGMLAYSDKYANIKDNTTSEGPFWNAYEWGLKTAAAQ
ncbi:MAG: ABC transporter family substrate-binding protein [Acidimicrobiales bacterium]